ncbi:MAG: hypothetical protein A2020_08935 [Lentisphaerae bacterium GWF2_45_14]|nr:MAG: hypothetical protein A2020_08935 [Lentisphaerae bacterium GWF2_45_14]
MEHFTEFFTQAGEILKSAQVRYVYWFLALFGTAIFLVQLVMVFFGMQGDTDTDADGDISFGEHADTGIYDLRFFSLRTIIAFITFFGWGGVMWGDAGWGGFFGASACGILMMFVTAFMIFGLIHLQKSGNIYHSDYIGCTGSVYLKIPAGRVGSGIVTASVKGTQREIKAVADEELPTGTAVTIESELDGTRFLVKKLN